MPEADVLDQVRAFRAQLAGLDDGAHDRIRALIVARAQAVADEQAAGIDQSVIDSPAPPARRLTPLPTPPRSFDDDTAAAVVELPGAAPRSPATRPARLVAVAAAILVLVLAAGVLVRMRAPDEPPAQPVTVATEPSAPAPVLSLADLAALEAAQPDQPLSAGEFAYSRVERGELSGQGAFQVEQLLVRTTRERWAPPSGPGRSLTGPTDARPFDDPTAPPQPFLPAADDPLAQASAFSGLSYDQLRQLPTESAALRSVLAATGTRSGDTRLGLVELSLDLLAEPATPPAARRALVALLADEGMQAADPAADRRGRPGAAFAIPARDGTGTWSVVIDPANGHLLGWDYTDPGTGLRNRYAVYLDQSITRDTTSH